MSYYLKIIAEWFIHILFRSIKFNDIESLDM